MDVAFFTFYAFLLSSEQTPGMSSNIFCFVSLLFGMATMIRQCEPEDRLSLNPGAIHSDLFFYTIPSTWQLICQHWL